MLFRSNFVRILLRTLQPAKEWISIIHQPNAYFSFIIENIFRDEEYKKLAIALLVVVLSGCAAVDNKSDSEIYQAAIDAVTRESGKVKP